MREAQVQDSAYCFSPPARPSVAIAGTDLRFPVHRIYCAGRNYAAHAREMGKDPDREPPFFFSKPADAVVPNGADVVYPPHTANLQHEIELVVAIGKECRNVPARDAEHVVFGYAVGNDLTRRDLQLEARDRGRPWDTGKAFDHSAPITRIFRVDQIGHIRAGAIWLEVNGAVRQQARVEEMIWSVPELIAELSTMFTLKPGDLIYAGTPAGVGMLASGDEVVGFVDGLEVLRNRIV